MPFSIYYDLETRTGSVGFFYAKMYVVSYCIVVAFHPDLNIPRLYIYRSYDQTQQQMISTRHFEAIQNNFFGDKRNCNKTTYRQLPNAAFAVQKQRKKYCFI